MRPYVRVDGKVSILQDGASWKSELPTHATVLCLQDLLELI